MSGIKLGDIDVGDQIIDNEYRLRLLFKILENILKKNKLQGPLKEEIEAMKRDIEKELQEKYPNSGIKIT